MAALPDAAKVLRGAWVQTLDNQEMLNIFHILYTGAGANQSDLDTLTADWGAALKTFLNQLQEVDVLNNRFEVTDLTSHTALTSQVPITGTGTHSGGLIGANTACCISWHIHRRYRGGHPRTYVGGIPLSALNSEREFTVAYTNLASSAAETYLTAVPGLPSGAYGSLTPVNLSYFFEKAIRGVPVTDPILFPTTNTRIDSQRRRTGKR
jgi:hypothetical protein